MTKSPLKEFFTPVILLLCFILFTILVGVVDVSPIGPLNSEVGFSALNGAFSNLVGYNEMIYEISDYFGYLAIFSILVFFIMFVWIAIKKKSIFKVDKILWLYGFSMAFVLFLYVVFEFISLNMRPVLIEGKLEASYPSSHTLLAVCAFYFAAKVIPYFVKNKNLVLYLTILVSVFTLLTIILRTLSGVHWITDIIGSLILSLFVISLFDCLKTKFKV